jgi:hypothetical protein
VAEQELERGLYEALLTGALDRRLADLVVAAVTPELRALADAEAADRLSRHLATVVTRAMEALPEQGRAQAGANLIQKLIDLLSQMSEAIDRNVDILSIPRACYPRSCDASPTEQPRRLKPR